MQDNYYTTFVETDTKKLHDLEAVAVHVLCEIYELDPAGYMNRIEKIKRQLMEHVYDSRIHIS